MTATAERDILPAMSTDAETPPLNFTDDKWLEAWLDARPREDAIALATRAALRSMPMLAGVMTRDIENPAAIIVLPAFRAVSASSASRWGIDELSAAASTASAAADAAALSALVALNASHSIARAAASSAAFAASHSTARSCRSAARCVTYSAHSVRPTIDSALSAAWKITSAEATMIRDGQGATLIATDLWPDGIPDHVAENWHTLKSALLARHGEDDGEDWAVWTDWYENQLRGGPFDIPLERAIALIPDDIWRQGPKVANAEIRRLIEG